MENKPHKCWPLHQQLTAFEGNLCSKKGRNQEIKLEAGNLLKMHRNSKFWRKYGKAKEMCDQHKNMLWIQKKRSFNFLQKLEFLLHCLTVSGNDMTCPEKFKTIKLFIVHKGVIFYLNQTRFHVKALFHSKVFIEVLSSRHSHCNRNNQD